MTTQTKEELYAQLQLIVQALNLLPIEDYTLEELQLHKQNLLNGLKVISVLEENLSEQVEPMIANQLKIFNGIKKVLNQEDLAYISNSSKK